MHEHIGKRPELRKELRELAQKDPEAFRRRIREIHERTGKSGKDGEVYFQTLVRQYFAGKLKRPFNVEAREKAGFFPTWYEELADW